MSFAVPQKQWFLNYHIVSLLIFMFEQSCHSEESPRRTGHLNSEWRFYFRGSQALTVSARVTAGRGELPEAPRGQLRPKQGLPALHLASRALGTSVSPVCQPTVATGERIQGSTFLTHVVTQRSQRTLLLYGSLHWCPWRPLGPPDIAAPSFPHPSFHGNEEKDQSWHVKVRVSP